jgi:hypothetical protein
MTRAIAGSAMGTPSATNIALATTPRLTIASLRACAPSAIRAGLSRRLPAFVRTFSAIALPTTPTAPAAPSASRCSGASGFISGESRRHAGAGEDGEHYREPRIPFCASGSQQESGSERQRGEGVARVVDQVGEQGDAAGGDVDRALRDRGDREDRERNGDGSYPLPRPGNRRVDQAVRVSLLVRAHVAVCRVEMARRGVRHIGEIVGVLAANLSS